MKDNEQLIINGVDVGACEYLTYELEEDGKYYWFCNIAPAGGSDECECNPECFYKRVLKQLARRTQECEIWKNQVLILNDEDVTVQVTQEQFEKYQKLKQECEELKSQIDADYEYYSQELKTLRSIIENKEKRNTRLFVISNNYRKALEEIEHKIIHDYCVGCDYSCDVCEYKEILDIINKAKDGKNAN